MPIVVIGSVIELIKVKFFWFWVWWCLIFSLVKILTWIKQPKKIDQLIIMSIIFWVVWVAVTVFWGGGWQKGFWGNPYRLDGWFTMVHLFIFCWLLIVFSAKERWNYWVKMISWGSIFVSMWNLVLGIAKYILKMNQVAWVDGGLGAGFGQPVFLGGYLLVTLPIIYFYLKRSNLVRFQKILLLGMVILAILLTKSVICILGLGLFFAWYLYEKGGKRMSAIFYIFLLFLTIGLTSGGIIFWEKQRSDFVAESRTRIWTKGILAMKERLWFGWGWTNFDLAFENIKWPIRFERDIYADKAHSHFLEIGTTTGLVGLGLYVSMIILAIRGLIKNNSAIARVFLGVLFLYLWQTQTNVISIAEEMIFWMVMAYAASNS
jgi:hypothetical protein